MDKMSDEQRVELAGNERKMLMNVQEEDKQEGASLLNVMLLNKRNVLSDDRLYLDNCSTVTAMKKKDFLKNVREADQYLSVSCNAGVAKAQQVGDLGDMESWYMPDGIANILSQHQVEQKYQVTYDSWDGYYIIHNPKRPVKFCKDHQGLPWWNPVKRPPSYWSKQYVATTLRGSPRKRFWKQKRRGANRA